MSYNKQIQALVEQYRQEVNDGVTTSRDIAAWILHQGKWQTPIHKAIDILAKDVSIAMRTQYSTDEDGRRTRRKHAVRYKETMEDGTKRQLVLWGDVEIAAPNFMYESFQQRRLAIADACWQLKQDVDSYNKFHNKAAAIQIWFDFREDLEEREASGDYGSPDEPETPEI